jgi:hypothetical protein
MSRIWCLVFSALVTSMLCNTSLAFEFERPQEAGVGTPQVIGGAQVTDPGEWPATFIFRGPLGSCTATAVGNRVILTAAHCIEHEETGSIRVRNEAVPIQCFHHPGWGSGNQTTDFALCLTQTEMTGFPFEVVSTAIAFPRVGDPVLLLGFGCTEEGGHDGGFGTLFRGTATTVRRPQGENIDTVTQGGAAVCFGDSGGSAYFLLSPNSTTRRSVIAVNSRGDISKFSFLSTLATPQFVDWAVEWSNNHGVAICGLNIQARGCR